MEVLVASEVPEPEGVETVPATPGEEMDDTVVDERWQRAVLSPELGGGVLLGNEGFDHLVVGPNASLPIVRLLLASFTPQYTSFLPFKSNSTRHANPASAFVSDSNALKIRKDYGSVLAFFHRSGRRADKSGGGCSETTSDGIVNLRKDQVRTNPRIVALLNSLATQTPVCLIAGSGYAFFPWLKENDVRYAVLGYYFVTHCWPESEPVSNDAATYHFRFEWVPSQGDPWFENCIGTPEPAAVEDYFGTAPPPLPTTTCNVCASTFTSIYEEPISCYNEHCSNFFHLNGSKPPLTTLKMRPSILNRRPAPTWLSTVPEPLLPAPLSDINRHVEHFNVPGIRAFHCLDCGRLSSRSEWQKITCEHCGKTVVADFSPVSVKTVSALEGSDEARKRVPPVAKGVGMTTFSILDWEGITFNLSDTARVHHLWKVGDTDEADRIFGMVQEPESTALLKRNPLSSTRLPGGYLQSTFCFNAGEPYNYAAKVPSVPFSEAPEVISGACDLLTGMSKLATMVDTPDFNEVLMVAYRQGGKMNFHTDGEKGLGNNLDADSTSDHSSSKPPRAAGKVVLELQLVHGDITIMEGEDCQKLFEHSVVPSVGLRFGELDLEMDWSSGKADELRGRASSGDVSAYWTGPSCPPCSSCAIDFCTGVERLLLL
ncbi:hypothetical protein MNV49_005463 [Pseudohyphozyma bogoriensis]|nr:hypothetical protein MNV49_005463 [Pseudohyphozyma bogoriensis]